MQTPNNLYPVGGTRHIVFCIIATLFFLAQFLRTRHWYQLILAVAVPCSMLVYIAPENDTLYYGVGILEAVLLAAALVTAIVQGKREAKQAAENGLNSSSTEA